MRREQPHGVPQGLELSCPVVSRPAGFEDDRCGWALREEREESIAREAPFFVDVPRAM
jgi:hypothetical protein